MTSRETALAAGLECAKRAIPLQDALGELLARSGLDARDRALAEEVAFGSLRRRLTLELALSRVVSRPLGKMQPALAEALRQAAYQVLFLDRVPASAAVNETVNIVKARMGKRPGDFANAVLRSLGRLVARKDARAGKLADPRAALASREGRFVVLAEHVLPDPASDESGWLAGAYGYPRWMVERWLARHGRERAERILEWGNTPPALSVRLNRSRLAAWPLAEAEAERAFRGCGAFRPGEVEGTYVLEPEVPPGELPGLAEGLFRIQDETQTRAARLLAPEEGARVLDLCAGMGGKSVQLAEMVGPEGRVTALDTDAGKLAKAREAAARLGLDNIDFVEGDCLTPPGAARGMFEYVLLDAPCSNLGALDRRPEVRYRASPAALSRLAGKERALLEAALERLAPGCALVYSVCSFEEEETGSVVRSAIAEREELHRAGEYLVLPEPARRDGGYAARIVRSCGPAGGAS